MRNEQKFIDDAFRPSSKVAEEIASAKVELAEKKIEIEKLRGQEKGSAQKKCVDRVAVAQAEVSKAEKDMQQELSICDNKCNAMLRRCDSDFAKTLMNLTREFESTHRLELQPGTPENVRKYMKAKKEDNMRDMQSLKRKLFNM